MITEADILKARILIVDDKDANIALLTRMLEGAGYEDISSTMDSGEVCELHLRHPYDLILLDLQMPGMDGFQVMENLKEIETGGYLPVLVVTAQPGHKLRALRAGARDFVSKPFDLAEVLIRVRNLVEVRLLHAETVRLYDRVLTEQGVSKRLLLNILPHDMVERMAENAASSVVVGTELVSGSYAEVTALFGDLVAFTHFAEGSSARVLTGVLEDLSSRFTSDDAGVERKDVMGNALMAAVGLPEGVADHSVEVTQSAIDLMGVLDRFNRHSRIKLRIRLLFPRHTRKGPQD